jgi:hypothetical protein
MAAGIAVLLAGNSCRLGDEGRDRRSEVGYAFSFQRFSFLAFALARQLWSEDFTPKLFCNV